MTIQSALIVDDSKLARITLRKKLQRHGVQAEMAESAQEALEKLKTQKPEIIFMDHLMPEMDGFEATQVIRKMDGFRDLPIVMCTGKDHDGYLAEAQSVGANSTLAKPPTEESLSSILETDFSKMVLPKAPATPQEVPAEIANLGDEVLDLPDDFLMDAQGALDELEAVMSAEEEASLVEEGEVELADESLDDLLNGLLDETNEPDMLDVQTNVSEEVEREALDIDSLDTEEVVLADTQVEKVLVEPAVNGVEEPKASVPAEEPVMTAPAIDEGFINAQVEIALEAELQILKKDVAKLVEQRVEQALAEAKSSSEAYTKQAVSSIKLPKGLDEEAVKALVMPKLQSLWKKTATSINDQKRGFSEGLANYESTLLQKVDEKLAAATAEVPSEETPDDDLVAVNLEEQLQALQIELLDTQSSIRSAKVVGFLGFLSGIGAAAFMAAKFFGYI